MHAAFLDQRGPWRVTAPPVNLASRHSRDKLALSAPLHDLLAWSALFVSLASVRRCAAKRVANPRKGAGNVA